MLTTRHFALSCPLPSYRPLEQVWKPGGVQGKPPLTFRLPIGLFFGWLAQSHLLISRDRRLAEVHQFYVQGAHPHFSKLSSIFVEEFTAGTVCRASTDQVANTECQHAAVGEYVP